MAKRTNTTLAFEDFEKKANEFMNLTLAHCEEELRRIRSHYLLPKNPKRRHWLLPQCQYSKALRRSWRYPK